MIIKFNLHLCQMEGTLTELDSYLLGVIKMYILLIVLDVINGMDMTLMNIA